MRLGLLGFYRPTLDQVLTKGNEAEHDLSMKSGKRLRWYCPDNSKNSQIVSLFNDGNMSIMSAGDILAYADLVLKGGRQLTMLSPNELTGGYMGVLFNDGILYIVSDDRVKLVTQLELANDNILAIGNPVGEMNMELQTLAGFNKSYIRGMRDIEIGKVGGSHLLFESWSMIADTELEMSGEPITGVHSISLSDAGFPEGLFLSREAITEHGIVKGYPKLVLETGVGEIMSIEDLKVAVTKNIDMKGNRVTDAHSIIFDPTALGSEILPYGMQWNTQYDQPYYKTGGGSWHLLGLVERYFDDAAYIFIDDFLGPALDASKWQNFIVGGGAAPIAVDWVGGAMKCVTAGVLNSVSGIHENIKVWDSQADMRAKARVHVVQKALTETGLQIMCEVGYVEIRLTDVGMTMRTNDGVNTTVNNAVFTVSEGETHAISLSYVASQAKWYGIFDGLVKCQTTATKPTGAGGVRVFIKTLGNVVRTMYIDTIKIYQER